MKYTFNISKNTTNNTKSNNNRKSNDNYSTLLNDLLSTRINDINTYMFEKKSPKIETYTFKKEPEKSIDITIDIIKKNDKPTYKEFCKAFSYLMSSDSYDTYDFKLDDGTPIKMFSDEIQIGYELIPLTDGTKRIYDMLSDNKKREIIDIYIDITK